VDSYENDGTPIPSFSFRYEAGEDLGRYLLDEIRPACLLVTSGAFSMYVDDPVGPLELDDAVEATEVHSTDSHGPLP
jgi:hypothetical protein